LKTVENNLVFVLSSDKKPLPPIHPGQARRLLNEKKAAVFRRFPFTIILKTEMPVEITDAFTLKIDPGSRTTGMSVLQNNTVIWAAELEHRGLYISQEILKRAIHRRSRKYRKTRYRCCKRKNKLKGEGWLPPSLLHRVFTTETWVKRLKRYLPLHKIIIESVSINVAEIRKAELEGKDLYEHNTLEGQAIKQFLLEKYKRTCQYCGATKVPLQVEHVIPKIRGGSNRITNLVIACKNCNLKKGAKDVEVFLKNKPDVLNKVKKNLTSSYKDETQMNSVRNKLIKTLSKILPVETGYGYITRHNRVTWGYPKAHWIDSACVGESLHKVMLNPEMKILFVKCTGHGNRQMCRTNKYGNPILHRERKLDSFGFTTGDIVKGFLMKGKCKGWHTGRVTCRSRGTFTIFSANEKPVHVKWYNCNILHRRDGYSYLQDVTKSTNVSFV